MHAACSLPFRVLAAALLLTVTGSLRAELPLPNGGAIARVDFERHVMGILSRTGCNTGSCHGSFQGKNGFRLSLFGYDPEKDHVALTHDLSGRRINRADPDRSLLLLKATGQVEHGGGRRFGRDSWQYQILREWIVGGATWTSDSGAVKAVVLTPSEVAFTAAGQRQQLHVRAEFSDGSEEDVTPLCDFRVNDDAVAEVSNLGLLQARRPGDTAVVVGYRGNIVSARILVPAAAPAGFHYPDVPEANFIDQQVFAKLRRLNMVPSDLCGDAEFLRRITIDTIGSLPSPEEVRAFLADSDPEKRARKIDQLLAHPLHAALWATKFCDITGNNTQEMEGQGPYQVKLSQMWHDWFRKRVADNLPYDEMVRGVLCATSRDGLAPDAWLKQVKALDQAAEKGFDTSYADRPSLDLFWRRRNNPPLEQVGEKVAAAFLGVRLECAQCHKHPFDRWTQADYRSFANVFGQVTTGSSPEAAKTIEAENAERKKQSDGKKATNPVREVYLAEKVRALGHPDRKQPLPAKALGGPVIAVKKGRDARADLFEWMRSADNPFFARSFVNRVWGNYLGVGLVDPVDDFAIANPPTNAKLLDALARDFVLHKYDLRALERTILNSRTYQLASATNASNKLDRNNYSHAYVRPLMAEAVVDVLNTALGVTEDFGADGPAKCRAVEIGASRVQNQTLSYTFRTFGRPPRTSACDCERASQPALPQTLFLMTDQTLQTKLGNAKGGRLKTLIDSKKSDDDVLDELFLATLTRLPTDKERKSFTAYRAGEKDRAAAYTGTLWALINTREFILNH